MAFLDKFINVLSILLGWLVIKLSIIPLFASTSHKIINVINIVI